MNYCFTKDKHRFSMIVPIRFLNISKSLLKMELELRKKSNINFLQKSPSHS